MAKQSTKADQRKVTCTESLILIKMQKFVA